MKKFQKNYLFFIFLFFVSMFVSAQSHAHELEQDSTGNTLKINVNNDSTTLPLPGVTVTITNTPAWISMGTTSSSVGTVEASGRRPASFTFSVGKGSSPEEVLTGTIEARIESSSGDTTTISIPVVAKPVLGPCEEIKDGAIVEKDCDDQNECTKDTCNPDTGVCEHEDIPLDICETCKDKKIVPKCDDENLCTTDTCDPNTGDCSYETKDCNDNDQCTVDDCDPETGDCTNKNKCDDDNECTEDICNAETGECTHNLIPLDPCQVCRDKKIVPKCDDQDLCTEDSCDPETGVCSNVKKNCDDNDQCTTDSCDPDTGQCENKAKCDDNNMCTTDECDPQSGECKNTSKNCDDGNLCTTDSCDPQTGICQNISKCDDNNDCTIDHCDPGTGRCQHLLKSMNRCQRCVDGKIESKDCNDNDPCTSDSCDSSTGNCVHTPLKKCDKDNSDPTFIQMPVVHSNNSVPKIPYIFSPVSSPGQKDTITISYEIPMKSLVTIMIYDSDNSLVRILINDQIYNAGMASDTWDGKTDTDTLVSDGKYLFFITGINLHHSLETWSQQGEIIVDNVLPTVQIKNIQADTPQYAHYTVHGTASDAHFDQLFFECFNEYTHVYLELKEYPVINDILASFNALYVQEDTYTIRLSVYDQAGNSSFEHFDVKIQPEKSGLEIFINEVSQIPLPGSEGYVPTSDATDVWIEDQLPDGSTQIGNWKWDNEIYYSGLQSHTSDSLTNTFQHYLIHADKTLSLGDNDNIIQYIYIDSLNQPDEILMQFYTDSGNGEHRAFWGANQIPTGGRTGSASLYRMGSIPPSGKWVRLKIPAIQVGLAGKEVKGIYFASNNGKVYWDKTTKSDDFNESQKDSWMSASQMGHDDRSDTVIRYYLSEDTNISLFIYDKDNRLIKTLLDNTFQNAGYHKIIWDGFDDNGLQVINDKYYFQFSAEDNLFSSNTYAVVKGQAIDIQHKQIVFDSLGNQYKIIDQRVNKFSDSDALLYTITASSLGQNQLSPTSLEIDCNDNLFILDDHHDKIYKINSNGLITLELPYDASQPWQDSQIPYRLDGMIIDDNNHLVISSQNYTETIHLVPGRGIIDISDITAKIRVPYPDSLVSYSVPVIGTASAKRFKEYIVEYGAGESPQEWTTLSTGQSEVFDDYKLLHSVSTVYGNLATWHTTQRVGTATGNESYYIPMGTYTIRLTVFDQLGNSKQDSTVVEMAHLVGRWGGSLISNDGMVKLHFPHNPISDDYDLFSITAIPLNEAPAIDDPHLIRISQIYRIKPAGYQFLKSCTFEMYYMDEQIEGIDENTLKIYRWNPIIQQWIYVYADNKPETNALSCQLSKFNDYEVYYAVMSDPPPAPILFQPDTPTKLRSVTLFGRATPGVNVEIFVNDVSKTITQADENTGLFMHAGLELSLGNNTIKAQAVDPVGNTSLFSDLISILLEDSEPDMITSISFKTSDFTIEYTDDIAIGQSLYIELNARDIDNQAVNTAMVTVRSSATDYSGISVQLLESSQNSGIYRGKVKLAEISNPYNGEIGVSPSLIEMVTAISDVNANISVSVQTVDAVPPKAPLISSTTHPSFCQNTFEVDSGEWSNMSNIYGATVQRTQVQKFSGDYAIQMTNENTGGDFANFVVATPFDARQYPILSFNYKVSQDIKLNLIAYVNGMWKEIIFTDDPKTVETFGDDLYRPIGQFENVIANGQWQHTQINLFNLLSNDAPDQASYIVEELFFSDYNLPAWMELVMGEENTKGATWYVDNFIISEGGKSNSHPVFHITPNDASVTQYSYKLDQNSGTIPDRIADCSVNDIDIQGVPDGSWYFHVRALDGGGNWGPANHYRIMIDTTGPIVSSPVPADNSTSGSLEVKLMITDDTGSGVNPKTIQIQLNDVVYDMDSGALQYDDISGILTLSVWKANFDTTPWIDGESVHASLIAVEDFAGNPLSDIYNWTWKVDYSTLAGGFLSLLTTQGGNTPSWSYDGSQIAFMSERSTNQDIWVINSDDYAELNNSIIQITTHSANDHHPAFSTTDNRIAFVSDRNDNEHIYVVRSDGTGLLQLTFADTDDSHPSWSPDSSQIVFSRNNEIWVINADGSNETQITFDSVEENLDPVWSPSGQRIAFTKSLYSDEVSVINSDGTDLAILTDSGRDFLPTWSKQTNQIIFVTNRDNSSAIHIMNINGSNDVLYLDNQQWWDTEPDQSPVDEKLAFQSTRNGSWNIWIKNNLEISELSSDTRSFSPNGDNINDSVSITFRLTGGITNIQLTIYDSSEKIVRTLVDNQPASVGENEIIWDGMDDDSTVVNDGSYTCTLLIAGIVGNDTIERHQNIIIDTQPPVFKDWVIPEDHFTGGEPTISVTVSDREMNNNAVVMQYAIASISGLETPDILNWSDFATGPTGNLRVKWSNYNSNYLFLRSYAEDNQGNANYSDIQKVLIGSTPPKAIPQVYDLDEDNVISIILEGYDSYNTTLDFYISKQPLHGKLSGTAPELIFTPDTNYSGSDRFTFIVNNGTMNSEPADVTINILPVADMPSLSIPDILTANEDTAIPLTIVAQCTDIDGSEYLTDIQLSNIPDGAILSSGSAIGNSWFISPNQLSDLTITPPANNADDFTISVSVASAETLTSSYFSVEGQIEINVIPVADAPTMTVIEDITAVEDMPISFSIAPPQLTDIDGSEVLTSISVSGLPKDFSLTNGTVSGQSWVLTPGQLNDLFILPATNFSDSFTLTLSVGSTEIENNSQAFHIENIDMVIEPVPDAPVLSVANIITTNEDTKSALVIAVELSDHSETLGNLIITGIPSGITISGGTIIENSWIVNPEQLSAIYFIPPENDDSDFILTITAASFIENGYSATAVRNAEVIVYPVNDPPVINIIDNFSMFEDFTETIDFKIYDIDSSALTVTYQTDNENLFSDIRFDGEDENRTMKIIPSPDENGIANINISVSDGSLTVTNALSLNITPVNDSPTMSALDNMTMDEDAEAISKSFTVNDIDSEPQLIEIYTYSSNQLLIPDNNLTITGEYENYSLAILPFTNQSGIAQITVTVSDGIDQQEVYFDVIVNAVADPPSLSLVNIAYGLEGPSIPLVIAPPELMDNDGSEQLSPITVEGVPPGATLSQGTFISNTTWTLLPDQLSDLSIIPDQNNDDDFQLNVRVSAIELSGDVAVAFQTITVVTLANILPSDLLAPQTIIIGKPFETIWSVKNSGNVLTTQNWQECLYLTADSLIEPITMGCIDQENSLYPGDSYSITITRSLKIDEIPEGSYYLTVWINPDQRQSEIQTIDNQLTSPLINVVKAPNLKITQSLNNSSALAGTGIQLSYTVVNSGNKETSGLWTDCLSIVSIADPNIRQSLGCYESGRFISIDESYMYSMNINLPCLNEGDYQIVIDLDQNNKLLEFDDLDNQGISSIHIYQPHLSQINFNDLNGDSNYSEGDELYFYFTEPMDPLSIQNHSDHANQRLMPDNQSIYGHINHVRWTHDNQIVVITLTQGTTITKGQWIQPDNVIDLFGNQAIDSVMLPLTDSIVPQLVQVVSNYPSPVPGVNNYRLTLQFNESMKNDLFPAIHMIGSGQLNPVVPDEGEWISSVYPHDTFVTSGIPLTSGMDGSITVAISQIQDMAGNVIAPLSNIYAFVLDATPPQSPTATILSTTCQSAIISWENYTKTTDLAGYQLYIEDNPVTQWTDITPDIWLSHQMQSYELSRLIPGKNLYVYIIAVDEVGNLSPPAEPISIQIEKHIPPKINVSLNYNQTPDQVLLSWHDYPVEELCGFKEFKVYGSLTSINTIDGLTPIHILDATTKEVLISQLDRSQSFFFAVVGFNDSNEYNADISALKWTDPYAGTIQTELTLHGDEYNQVYIHNDLVVSENGRLIIPKGTTILMVPGKGITIEQSGVIIADGTSLMPIIFTSMNDQPSSADWNGITLTDNTNLSVLNHCIIKYGKGLTVNNSNPQINAFSGLYNTPYALQIINNSTVQTSHAFITYNSNGVWSDETSGIMLTDSVIKQNTNLHIESLSLSRTSLVSNWWGTTDLSSIRNQIKGQVQIDSILEQEPLLTPAMGTANQMTQTGMPEIDLNLACRNAIEMRISEDSAFKNVFFQSFQPALQIALSEGGGNKTLYAQFRASSGAISELIPLPVNYLTDAPVIQSFSLTEGMLIQRPILITASANSPSTDIDTIKLFVNNTLVAQSDINTLSHRLLLNDFEKGIHRVKLLAKDSVGHFSTEELNVVIDAIPPPAPVIHTPTSDMTVTTGFVIVSGQAEPDISIRITRNGAAVGMINTTSDGYFEMLETPLVEGTNKIAALAMDDLGISSQSNSVSIIKDTGPPSTPVIQPAITSQKNGILIQWLYPSTGERPTSFHLYRSETSFESIDQAILVASNIKELEYIDTLTSDGTYFYAIVGIDGVGNMSELSQCIEAVYDNIPPAFDISLAQASPFGIGPVDITITVSERLIDAPILSITPENSIQPIIITLIPMNQNTYIGSYTITNETLSGNAEIYVSGVDVNGNAFHGKPSGGNLIIDSQGPVMTILSSIIEPVQVTQAIQIELNTTFSEQLSQKEMPKLIFSPPEGEPVSITLSPKDDQYVGYLTLTPSMGSGEGIFTSEATDINGNPVAYIEKGQSLEIYNTSFPTAPDIPLHLQAQSLKNGQIQLTWDGQAKAHWYRMYRSAGDCQNITQSEIVADQITQTTLIDLPYEDGTYCYAVISGRKGAESQPSMVVIGISDRVPPDAPENIAVSLNKTSLTISWEPPESGEFPDTFKIYRNGLLIQQVDGNVSLLSDYPSQAGVYTYCVASTDYFGNENKSEETSINLTVGAVHSVQVSVVKDEPPEISWQCGDETVVGYNVWKGNQKINQTLLTETVFVDKHVTGKNTITYQIRAVNSQGEQSPPREVTIYPIDIQLQNQPLVAGYFNQINVSIFNLSQEAIFPFNQLKYEMIANQKRIFYQSKSLISVISEGHSYSETVVMPCDDSINNHLLSVIVSQTTKSGSFIQYQHDFELTNIEFSGPAIDISLDSPPVAGGTIRANLCIMNHGHADMMIQTNKVNGTKAGQVHVKVTNQAGLTLNHSYYSDIPENAMVAQDNNIYWSIPTGQSKCLSISLAIPQDVKHGEILQIEGIVDAIYYHSTARGFVQASAVSTPIEVQVIQTDYTAIASFNKDQYVNDEPIIITGKAIDKQTGLAKSNTEVKVGLSCRGVKWSDNVLTDGSGTFEYLYNAPSGMSGHMVVWASHPQVDISMKQDECDLSRLYINPQGAEIQMTKGDSLTFNVAIMNPGDLPLTGLSALFTSTFMNQGTQQQVEGLTGETTLTDSPDIGANDSKKIQVTLNAALDIPDTIQTQLQICSSEDVCVELPIHLDFLPAEPVLNVNSPEIGYIDISIDRGKIINQTVNVSNNGLLDMENVEIILPETMGWIQTNLVEDQNNKTSIDHIRVGETRLFDLIFMPPDDLAFGLYSDKITFKSSNTQKTFEMPVFVMITSEQTGSVLFHVSNILTKDVENATIRMRNSAINKELRSVKTDENGNVQFSDIHEGRWSWQVTAKGHRTKTGFVSVTPGQDALVEPVLTKSLVTISFKVEPVQFTDKYDIKIEQTFETHVPTGVLVLEPPTTNFYDAKPNMQYYTTVKVKNYGLIKMVDVVLKPSESSWGLMEPLVTYIPVLEAMEEIDVPYRMTYYGLTTSNRRKMIGDDEFNFGDCMSGGFKGMSDSIVSLANVVQSKTFCLGKDEFLVVSGLLTFIHVYNAVGMYTSGWADFVFGAAACAGQYAGSKLSKYVDADPAEFLEKTSKFLKITDEEEDDDDDDKHRDNNLYDFDYIPDCRQKQFDEILNQ